MAPAEPSQRDPQEGQGFTPYHRPVMVEEVLDLLAVRPGGRYLDGTVGEGGHALALLRASAPDGRLLGLDLDPVALERARRRLAPFEGRVRLVRASYARMGEVARAEGFAPVDGVLLDLGLSSLQLEGEERGFSFHQDAPLDMRFDPDQPLTAADLVNRLPERELARLLREYGEEPRARAIARAVVRHRPVRTARQLARIVEGAVGRRGRLHPATRTFQALRIAVNRELEVLEEGLREAVDLLAPGGRLAVLSYHSLEDRIVKRFLREMARGCTCPPDLPRCRCGRGPVLRPLTRKPVRPRPEEVRENPRARSARLRAGVKEGESPSSG